MLKRKPINLQTAIIAWKTLFLEASTNEDRYENVWEPTQRLLDILSAKPPPILTCFLGKHFMFPNQTNGVVVHLYLIANNCAVYIGTLFDNTASQEYLTQEINRLTLVNRRASKKLKSAGHRAIIRNHLFCKIPANTDCLCIDAATKAVKRYLAIRAPALVDCKIIWLSPIKGVILEGLIKKNAEQTAKPSTWEEQKRAIAEDELEL